MPRDRTPLQVMEQVAMTAVFALCAAICLQAFSTAYEISKLAQIRETASALADAACASMEAGTGLARPGQDAEVFIGTDGRPRERSDADYRLSITWNDMDGLPAASMRIDITSPDGTEPYVSRTAVWQTERTDDP